MLTDASESDTEFPSSGYTETGVTDSAECATDDTQAEADQDAFRAIDPSQPVSSGQNSVKISDISTTCIGASDISPTQAPMIAKVTINKELGAPEMFM